MKEKYFYYNFNFITNKDLSNKTTINIMDSVIESCGTKRFQTGGLQKISYRKWERLIKILNPKRRMK